MGAAGGAVRRARAPASPGRPRHRWAGPRGGARAAERERLNRQERPHWASVVAMDSPFITVAELARALEGSARPAILDASYLLLKPEFDGDFRSGSARVRWEGEHIPCSRYVDIQKQFSDPGGATHYAHPEPQAIA